MAPVLEKAAKDHFKGRINVGKLDATRFTELKDKHEIDGYPTLKYFEDGQVSSVYTGGRELESMIEFGHRMDSPLVRPFDSAPKLQKWLTKDSPERTISKEPLSRILVGKDGDVNDKVGAAVLQAAKETRPFHVFAKTNAASCIAYLCKHGRTASFCNDDTKLPALVRFEKNEKMTEFQGDLTNATAIEEWTKKTAAPVFAEIGLHNFGVLARQPGKMLVFVAFDPENKKDPETKAFLAKFREIAQGKAGFPDEVMSRLVFASVDVKVWGAYLEDYGVFKENLPMSVVVDYENNTYYVNHTMPVRELLFGAVRGTIPVRWGGMWTTPRKFYRAFWQNWPYSAGIGAFVLFMFAGFCYLLCFADDDEELRAALETAAQKNETATQEQESKKEK